MAGYDPLRGGERPALGADEPAPVDDLLGATPATGRPAAAVEPAASPARKVVIAKKAAVKKAAVKKAAVKKAAVKKAAVKKAAVKKASVERSAASRVDAVDDAEAASPPFDGAPRASEPTTASGGSGATGGAAPTDAAAAVSGVSRAPARSSADGPADARPVTRARPATGVRTRWRLTVLAAVIVALVVLSLRRRRANGLSGSRRP